MASLPSEDREDTASLRDAVRLTGLLWTVLVSDRSDAATVRPAGWNPYPVGGLPAQPLTATATGRVIRRIGRIVLEEGQEVAADTLRISLNDLLERAGGTGGRTSEALDALGTLQAERVCRIEAGTGEDVSRLRYLFVVEHRINGHPQGTVSPSIFLNAIKELQGRIEDCLNGKMVISHPATADQLKQYRLPKSWAIAPSVDGPKDSRLVVYGGVVHTVAKGHTYNLFVYFWDRTKSATDEEIKTHLKSTAGRDGLVRIVRRFLESCKRIKLPWTVSISADGSRYERKPI